MYTLMGQQKQLLPQGCYYIYKLFQQYKKMIQKSPLDQKNYRLVKLENQLRVLLAQYSSSNCFGLGLTLAEGSFSDPLTHQGLSHFVQHLLVSSSQRYPQQNYFDKFVNINSGQSNAFTSETHTNYSFTINQEKAIQACQIFSSYFQKPVFNLDFFERELESIHSQFNNQLQNDQARILQLLRKKSNANSDFSKFQSGNKGSLSKEGLQSAIKNHYHKRYSANNMALVVISKRSLDQLQNLVKEYFSKIPNLKIDRYKSTQKAFLEEHLCKFYKVVPVQQIDQLNLFFSLPNYEEQKTQNPGRYLQYIVGAEGKGSLSSTLIQEGLIQQLVCYFRSWREVGSILQVKMKLTEKGFKQYIKVVNKFFVYVRMVQSQIAKHQHFLQTKRIWLQQFFDADPLDQFQFVQKYSVQLLQTPPCNLFNINYCLNQFKPELFVKAAGHLHPSNLVLMFKSQQFQQECTLVQQHYGTKFKECPFPNQVLNFVKFKGQIQTLLPIHMPLPNSFICQKNKLIQENDKVPRLIYQSDNIQYYFKRSAYFMLNKASCRMIVISANESDIMGTNCKALIVKFIQYHLRQLFQQGLSAGIQSQIDYNEQGLLISLDGNSGSLPVFFEVFVKQLLQFDLKKISKHFNNIKQQYLQQLNNFEFLQPRQQAEYKSLMYLADGQGHNPSKKELASSLKKLKFQTLNKYYSRFFDKTKVILLVNGNVDQQTYLNFPKCLISLANQTPPQQLLHEVKSIILKKNSRSVLYEELKNKQQTNCMCSVIYEIGLCDTRLIAKWKILSAYLSNFLFDILRTKQQLGYNCQGYTRKHRSRLYFFIQVQSASHPPSYLQPLMKQAFYSLKQEFKKLSQQQFTSLRQGAYKLSCQQYIISNQQANQLWKVILDKSMKFLSKQEISKEILVSTHAETINQFQRVLHQSRLFQLHLVPSKYKNQKILLEKSKVQFVSKQWLKKQNKQQISQGQVKV